MFAFQMCFVTACMRHLPSPRVRFVIAITAAFLLCASKGFAQYDTSAVVGSIRDSSAARIADARVVLRNVDKGTVQETNSTSSGDYEFPSVQVGNYTVTVTAKGFAETNSNTFEVVANARQRVDIPLVVQSNTEVVEVNAGATALQTDTNDHGQVIEDDEIVNLPLNGREYTDLALLSPGVSSSSLQDSPTNPRRGSFHTNGMRSSVNNFLLDGLDNNAYQNANQGFNNQAITPSPDGIREFKIITNNYPAEYGRSGGSVVNTITRSGTNLWHGSIWEYLRNTMLDAYGPLVQLGQKPVLIQNQFGATLGGPILRNKLFFFANYEGFRVISKSYTSSTIPTMDQRSGTFYNESGTPIPIENPYTGVTYVNGIVPTTDITPFAAAVLAALPAPTNSSYTSNYVQLARGQNTRDLGELRLDRDFGTRLQTFARFSQLSNHIEPTTSIPGPSGGNSDGHIFAVTSRLALGLTYVVSPHAVLDSRLGFTRTVSGKFPYNYGQTSFYTKLGIPYPIDPRVGNVSLNSQSVKYFTAFGTETSNQTYQKPFTINPKISYSVEHGRHSISFGYEFVRLVTPTEWQIPVYGTDTYNQDFTKGSGAPASSTASNEAYYLADFLYGARSQYELANYDPFTKNMRFHSAYVEDSWRAASKLTLNYGLRYEFTVPDFESNNRLANFDPQANALKLASNGSYASRSLVHSQNMNFAPRFGVAYALTPKLVVRASYGISYIQFTRDPNNSLEWNGPFAIDTLIQQTSLGGVCPNNSESYTCFRTTMQGYPASMISAQAFNTVNSVSYYMPPDTPTGYVQSDYLGFQYQIDPHTIVDIAYVGEHGAHVRVDGDYNQAPPVSAANSGTLQQRRPIANFTDIRTGLSSGFLIYNALQAKVERQWKNLFVLNSFSWSQAFDNASDELEASHGDSSVVNINNIAGDAGISGYNQPLNDSLAVVWSTPKIRARNGMLREVFDAWRVSAINRMASGLPLNLYYGLSTASLTTNLGYNYRPNITGPARTILNPKSEWRRDPSGQFISNLFDTTRVLTPAATSPYGNFPRNSIRFVPSWNLDIGISRSFHVYRESVLQFRAEAFNAPNKTNWNAPDSETTDANFGQLTNSYASRQIQFALRYQY